MSDINITNLLDTAFVLLVTFMLVAPQLSHGMKLDLPDVATPPMTQEPSKTHVVSITKAEAGEGSEGIYLDNKRVTVDDLVTQLAQKKAADSALQVVVEADTAAPYGVFYAVVDAVKRAGVSDVGLTSSMSEVHNPSDKEKTSDSSDKTP
jgi:biopolymer transport protein ExbD